MKGVFSKNPVKALDRIPPTVGLNGTVFCFPLPFSGNNRNRRRTGCYLGCRWSCTTICIPIKNRNQCDQCGASIIVIVMESFSLSIVVIQIDLKK